MFWSKKVYYFLLFDAVHAHQCASDAHRCASAKIGAWPALNTNTVINALPHLSLPKDNYKSFGKIKYKYNYYCKYKYICTYKYKHTNYPPDAPAAPER